MTFFNRWAPARLVAALALSAYGDWLTTVALVVLLFRLTGSLAAPAGYIFVRVTPRVLGSIPGGILADRLSPIRLASFCWLLQGALTLSIIPFQSSLPGIFVCVAVAQLIGSFARPSLSRSIPLLVDKELISEVNAWVQISGSSSMFLGPALGSVLLVMTGVAGALIADSATFVLGSLLLYTVTRGPHRRLPPASDQVHVTEETRTMAGIGLVLSDARLRTYAAISIAGAAMATITQAFLVAAAHDRTGSDSNVGLLYSAVGFGSLVGAITVLTYRPKEISAFLIATVGMLELLGFSAFGLADSLWVDYFALGLTGLGGVLGSAWGGIDLQRRIAAQKVGRASGAVFLALNGGMMVGAIAALATSAFSRWEVVVELASVVGLGVIALAYLSKFVPRLSE